MNRMALLIFALVVSFGSTAFAMPVAPVVPQVTTVIQVESGCGLGVHRGPFGDCGPVAVYEGYDPYYRAYVRGYYHGYRRGYHDAVVGVAYPYVRYFGASDVVIVDRGVCGFGSYLSCSHGTCWRLCY